MPNNINLLLVSIELSIISSFGFFTVIFESFVLLSSNPSRSNNLLAFRTHRYKIKNKLLDVIISLDGTYTLIFCWYRFPHVSELLIYLCSTLTNSFIIKNKIREIKIL